MTGFTEKFLQVGHFTHTFKNTSAKFYAFSQISQFKTTEEIEKECLF